MKWITLAPFGLERCNGWFFSMNPDSGHEPVFVPAHYDHDRSRKRSGLKEWWDYLCQAWSAVKITRQHPGSGILTVFPQLAAAMALFKALGFLGTSVIGADFVLGGLAVCFKVLAEVVAADAGAGLAALLEVIGVVAGLVCATTKSTFNMPNKQPLAKMEQKKPKR